MSTVYPPYLTQGASSEDIANELAWNSTQWTAADPWTPDAYSWAYILVLAVIYRRFLQIMQRQTRRIAYPVRAELDRRLSSIWAHALNLLVGFVILGLQIASPSAWDLRANAFRAADEKHLLIAAKLMTLTYGFELAVVQSCHFYIVIHHFLTGALFFCSIVCSGYTKDPAQIKWGNMLLLQASLEPFVYAAMFSRHLSTWLDLQDRSPELAHRLRRFAARSMTVGAWIGPVQKVGPLIVALYVTCHVSWEYNIHNPFDQAAGIAWVSISIPLVLTLGVMQCVISYENFGIAANLRATADVKAQPRGSEQPTQRSFAASGALISTIRSICGSRRRKLASQDFSLSPIVEKQPIDFVPSDRAAVDRLNYV